MVVGYRDGPFASAIGLMLRRDRTFAKDLSKAFGVPVKTVEGWGTGKNLPEMALRPKIGAWIADRVKKAA